MLGGAFGSVSIDDPLGNPRPSEGNA